MRMAVTPVLTGGVRRGARVGHLRREKVRLGRLHDSQPFPCRRHRLLPPDGSPRRLHRHRHVPNSIADFGLDSEQSILAAALPSPMSIGIPAGDQPPIVFDGSAAFGADSQSGAETRSVLKQLGLQTAVVALGGIVAGVYQPETLNTEYEANQGCFIAVFDAAKLMPKAELGASMDRYISQAIAMQPIEGLELAELPGGDQVRRIQHCEAHGIEIEPFHAATLIEVAREFGVAPPTALLTAPKM
jgi:hypothetical protein